MSEQQQSLTIQRAIDIAVQHHTVGRLSEAESTYQQILQSYPNQPVALHLLGVIAHQTGKTDTAVELITKALAIKPDYAEAHNNLGNALQDLGKPEEAVASCEKALALKPDYADAHNNLGNALKDLVKLEEAVASYHKALNLKPDYPEAHYNLGLALQELGRLKDAATSYQKALGIKPDFAETHNNLGLVLQDLGKLEEAAARYRKALVLKPDFAKAHSNLGNALRQLGKVEEAVASYQKALVIKPDYAEAQHMLNSLAGNTPTAPPRGYVETLFDGYAGKFDNHLVKTLEYKTPFLMREIIVGLDPGRNKFEKAIDLGCGTGLCGIELRDISNDLTGIDLSKKMIAKAEERQIYDRLIIGDIVDILSVSTEKYDLFISSDVFVYCGELTTIFNAVRNCCNEDALFIFSVESQVDGEYSLLETGRYSHSENYILNKTSDGFKPIESQEVSLRKEKQSWIIGQIFVLQAS